MLIEKGVNHPNEIAYELTDCSQIYQSSNGDEKKEPLRAVAQRKKILVSIFTRICIFARFKSSAPIVRKSLEFF